MTIDILARETATGETKMQTKKKTMKQLISELYSARAEAGLEPITGRSLIPTTDELKDRLASLELYANLLTSELGSSKAGVNGYPFELAMALKHQARELHTILSAARVEVSS
jgi:hypothetical protein